MDNNLVNIFKNELKALFAGVIADEDHKVMLDNPSFAGKSRTHLLQIPKAIDEYVDALAKGRAGQAEKKLEPLISQMRKMGIPPLWNTDKFGGRLKAGEKPSILTMLAVANGGRYPF